MSMDLAFWKYKENVEHDHAAVYQAACCDGETMEQIETLPIDAILQKVTETFSDWTYQGGLFEKEEHGAFEVFTTSQIVRFDCHSMDYNDMNTLMNVVIDFGCPLYDPQVSERFDGWTDR